MDANCFLDLLADADHGIQRRHRLLKNHGDFAAAQRAHDRRRSGDEIVPPGCSGGAISVPRGARQPGLAAAARARRLESHQREREHRLAGTGFADDAERFAFTEREG